MSEFTESDIRAALDRALAGEPPFTLDREAVFAEGRRRVRRRRTAAYGLAAVTAVAVIGTSTLAAGALSTSPQPMPPAAPAALSTTATTVLTTPRTAMPPPISTTTTTRSPGSSVPPPGQASADHNSAVMHGAAISWPPDVVKKVGAYGEWYRFDTGGTLSARLVTPTGDRRLIVRLRGPDGVPPQTECPPVARADTACSRDVRPDGTVLRVSEDRTTSSVTATSLRPDGTYVTVQETASGIAPSRLDRVLDTPTVVALALVPGLSAIKG
ncbi:hypothetical protein [Actinokineospora spheciospongiae]|uniref:hypothetical protein n=1 Tax=Actinokineospora spheciospongiae TaxID=909613 RepID=UPI000D713885|nr:hypothetical protein [Actinokineospora spheciospongiae]PWW50880.1 hypothetical protein DFQ13_12128 [Actinokineospora spheciospongiae]